MVYILSYFLTGLLEQPGFPSGLAPTIVPFKLLLLGKSAVGKTSTVAKLAGKGVFMVLFYYSFIVQLSSEVHDLFYAL